MEFLWGSLAATEHSECCLRVASGMAFSGETAQELWTGAEVSAPGREPPLNKSHVAPQLSRLGAPDAVWRELLGDSGEVVAGVVDVLAEAGLFLVCGGHVRLNGGKKGRNVQFKSALTCGRQPYLSAGRRLAHHAISACRLRLADFAPRAGNM